MKTLLRISALCSLISALPAAPLVVTTNPILDDLVRQVAPENTLRTHCLLAPDADPHANETRPDDLRAIANAQLIIRNGLNLEPGLDKLIRNSGTRAQLLTATDGIKPILDDHNETDPHAWQNPLNTITYIENIRAALEKLLPQQTAAINQRAAAYTQQLRTLDKTTRAQLSAIPPQNRILVTTHDSLAYLARAYDLRILPIKGPDDHAEPTARQVAAIIDTIRAQKIPALFIDTTTNPKLARLIARETHTKLAPPLHTDTLPADSTYLETYQKNIATIAEALTPKN